MVLLPHFSAALRSAGRRTGARPQIVFIEQTSDLASLVVWTLFGVVAVPVIVDALGWQLSLYSVLSLTVVRGLPCPSLLGTNLSRQAKLFIAWFGPRGLASVVFALLTIEELGHRADLAVAVIARPCCSAWSRTGFRLDRSQHGSGGRNGRHPSYVPEQGYRLVRPAEITRSGWCPSMRPTA